MKYYDARDVIGHIFPFKRLLGEVGTLLDRQKITEKSEKSVDELISKRARLRKEKRYFKMAHKLCAFYVDNIKNCKPMHRLVKTRLALKEVIVRHPLRQEPWLTLNR